MESSRVGLISNELLHVKIVVLHFLILLLLRQYLILYKLVTTNYHRLQLRPPYHYHVQVVCVIEVYHNVLGCNGRVDFSWLVTIVVKYYLFSK